MRYTSSPVSDEGNKINDLFKRIVRHLPTPESVKAEFKKEGKPLPFTAFFYQNSHPFPKTPPPAALLQNLQEGDLFVHNDEVNIRCWLYVRNEGRLEWKRVGLGETREDGRRLSFGKPPAFYPAWLLQSSWFERKSSESSSLSSIRSTCPELTIALSILEEEYLKCIKATD